MTTFIVKTKVKNLDEYAKTNNGNCIKESFITFLKLRKILPVRVRGFITKNIFNDERLVHYWVECRGLVYDNNNYQVKIMNIEIYYEMFGVVGVEKTDSNGLFLYDNDTLGVKKDCVVNKK